MDGINSTSNLSGVDYTSCDYFKEKRHSQNNITDSITRLNNTSTELARHNSASPSLSPPEPGYAYFMEKSVNAFVNNNVSGVHQDKDSQSPFSVRNSKPHTVAMKSISEERKTEMINDLIKAGCSGGFIADVIQRLNKY